jgi:hypothetical protein
VATKDKARDTNRRVVFDDIEKGAYLVLRNSGVRDLHSRYGKEHVRIVNEAFLTGDIDILEHLLGLMAHKGEEAVAVAFDDLDNISLQTLTDKVRDAWSLSIHGRTWEGQIEHVQKLLSEQAGKEQQPDPFLTSPADTSDTSSDQPTGQD